ncbi:hypothetical protein JQX09_22520 [Sulfitobacter pseudonitzschiae]|uniref:ArsR family transcriptional regulator n=1 Tax=Pseudosulfitobacter pseudonitzschiae TaxID=1402135 RepID=A0A9Q2P5A7_9RHOB|nr:hypothetical protein [Pseudosulfitobacter pseudonitzschiae]MBM2294688.1 hypothetical protein [Pseudosulfitobacter pseudonitzschiae]MBM2299625.1 hypothetical protein [Pseudosulfitobacter pseudonitzschiae]MBM2304538.1 hypothetical protein [Pseudosulfitobacter pseudonitzschiae]MBM2314299.1 hypothetical protein [Pseudosulfitobacter pseudonitzschiae]MBM2319229.1 hypothetical protein [Pseudosulfitobacter pseudonitzschiae]
MSYAETVRKHRRLGILRHLEACSGYTSNASILTDVLDGVGIASTRDQIVTELTWLRENGFVAYDDNVAFVVVRATQTGVEIALGRSTHPDIQRPSPRGV